MSLQQSLRGVVRVVDGLVPDVSFKAAPVLPSAVSLHGGERGARHDRARGKAGAQRVGGEGVWCGYSCSSPCSSVLTDALMTSGDWQIALHGTAPRVLPDHPLRMVECLREGVSLLLCVPPSRNPWYLGLLMDVHANEPSNA